MAAKKKTTRKRTRSRRRAVGDDMSAPNSAERNMVQKRIAADKEAFLEALRNRLGVIAVAARDVGVSVRSTERWRKADPDFNERVLDELRAQRGFVETKLLQKIEAGDTRAMIFYLRCRGRNQGTTPTEDWKETHAFEHGGRDGEPIKTESAVNLSVRDQRDRVQDEALAASLAAAMRAAPHMFEGIGEDS